ncbi:ArsR/SmtB family transcription factor [Streptomyces sp. NPDC000880]
MVERSPSVLDLTYAALADPTRRDILQRLRRAEARVTDIARPLPMSLNAVSKHIAVLERAGLVRREIRGRRGSDLAPHPGGCRAGSAHPRSGSGRTTAFRPSSAHAARRQRPRHPAACATPGSSPPAGTRSPAAGPSGLRHLSAPTTQISLHLG